MLEPPLLAGADQATAADALLGLATTLIGAPETVGTWGVTRLLAVENGPDPTLVLAATLNWYDTPWTGPIVIGVGTTFVPAGAVTIVSGTRTPLEAKLLRTM